MRGSSNRARANQLVGDSTASTGVYWKRRPSEIKGYQRAFYYNDPDGNYIRVDYNTKSQKVRIFYESADEGGIAYYSVIEKGDVTSERNMTSGRTTSLTAKFSALAPLFVSLPNKEVLRLMGKNYGLADYSKELKEKLKRQKLEKTRQRYFKQEKIDRDPFLGDFDPGKGIGFKDFMDMGAGAAVSLAIYYYIFNYQVLGGFLAIYGISLGLIDIFLREREPIFFKIIIFLITGVGLFIYGYYIN
ncbi:MAG: hypothetical protein JXK07_00170 [Spirochaetes bacterium]|nr:hypothetical protein [Spirochaetota bacterium]MBN2770914.1 hypothetical protein [Spirochaetota bacterium]